MSEATSEQSVELADESGVRHKPKRGQEVTAFESAHKKEPPMRLELMTYALRKRGADDGTDCTATDCDEPESVVAPLVVLDTPDDGCDLLIAKDTTTSLPGEIPGDLGAVIDAWPRLPGSLKRAVLAIVESNTAQRQ